LFSDFQAKGTREVLDSAILKTDKEIKELPQDLEKTEKRKLLSILEKEFEDHPDCYCEAWEDFIIEIEEKFQHPICILKVSMKTKKTIFQTSCRSHQLEGV